MQKRYLGPLKVQSAPIAKWILNTKDIETFDYNTEAWVGETISKGMRKHQNAKCFNCDRIGYLKRDYRQRISRNNVSSENGRNRQSQPPGIWRRCDKG